MGACQYVNVKEVEIAEKRSHLSVHDCPKSVLAQKYSKFLKDEGNGILKCNSFPGKCSILVDTKGSYNVSPNLTAESLGEVREKNPTSQNRITKSQILNKLGEILENTPKESTVIQYILERNGIIYKVPLLGETVGSTLLARRRGTDKNPSL